MCIESGRCKCNIGGSWSSVKKIGGAAWIVRDDKGKVVMRIAEGLLIQTAKRI